MNFTDPVSLNRALTFALRREPDDLQVRNAALDPQLFKRSLINAASVNDRIGCSSVDIYRAFVILKVNRDFYLRSGGIYIKKDVYKLPLSIFVTVVNGSLVPYLCFSKRRLGEGSTKKVFYGFDLVDKEHVAIASYDLSKQGLDRCQFEFKVQQHFGEAFASTCYFNVKERQYRFKAVMPLANRGCLFQIMWQNPNLLRSRVNEIIRKLLARVREYHKSGVIIADINPSNILIHETKSGSLEVRINDLGLAITKGDKNPHRKTTDEYASPEQRGLIDSPVSTKTDVFQTARTIWEFLNPQEAKTFSTAVDYPAFWMKQRKAYPLGSIQSKLLDMLQLDPEARPSIEEVMSGD